MKTVWVVQDYVDYEGSQLRGIHKTKEEADAHMRDLCDEQDIPVGGKRYGRSVDVEEWTIGDRS